MQEIPESQRILVTAHDAFNYFGDSQGFEVRGLQGLSTESEYGVKDVQNMVDFLVENNIKAIFVESSVSDKAMNAVIEGAKEKGHTIVIGGALSISGLVYQNTFNNKLISPDILGVSAGACVGAGIAILMSMNSGMILFCAFLD